MKVYLSSTFADLDQHRLAACKAMRQLRVDVIAMEEYVAQDERPADMCIKDVVACDLYVGLFAKRYGHVPPTGNPLRRSITEMEYRAARDAGITTVVFLLEPDAPWKESFDDRISGEGDGGTRIRDLRTELSTSHTVGWFATPDDLAVAVSATISAHLLASGAAATSAVRIPRRVPHARQLNADLLLVHSSGDGTAARQLLDALGPMQLRGASCDWGLLARTADELYELDRLATQARSTVVLATQSSITMMAEDPVRTARVLGLLQDRTGRLMLAKLDAEIEFDAMPARCEVIERSPLPVATSSPEVELAFAIHRALTPRGLIGDRAVIGLPVVSVAMTADECGSLLDDPPSVVDALLATVPAARDGLQGRYGATRWAWRPFAGNPDSIEEILGAAVARENDSPSLLRGRQISLQRYQLDDVYRLELRQLYEDIARNGCLVVVDELSMFHDTVRRLVEDSPFLSGAQVAFVTVAPHVPAEGSPGELFEGELSERLQGAAHRFGEGLDPLCELGIPERRRLHRWLHGNLARTLDTLRDARVDEGKAASLAAELGVSPQPHMARMIAGEVTVT